MLRGERDIQAQRSIIKYFDIDKREFCGQNVLNYSQRFIVANNNYALELISKAQTRFGQEKLAELLNKSPRTIRRWISGDTPFDPARIPALEKILEQNKLKGEDILPKFTFIDLFAGIGGIRKGFEAHGGKCIFTSEWDSYSQKTYEANFSTDHLMVGDINDVMDDIAGKVPAHDVLLAGFPCQPFSIAGVSKKNALGRVHGFACQEQGNLFFKIADILAVHRPHAFLLENVKNLKSHDKGKTFKIIMDTLEKELEYKVQYRIIDGKGFVPQHRERIYIVGFREDTSFDWNDFSSPSADATKLKDILHRQDGSEEVRDSEEYILPPKGKVNPKYTLTDKLWNYLVNYAEKHKAAGNGFGFGLVGPNDTARTLSARYYKDGSEILIKQGGKKNPRRLTPRECSRLMGFDKPNGNEFIIPVSDTRAYKQFGNAVVVPVIEEIARIMSPHIQSLKNKNKGQTS